MHPEVVRSEEKLSHLFNEARLLQQREDVDDAIKAQFVWYLCVRTSGYVEYSARTILLEFFESSPDFQPFGDFVSNQLRLSREFPMRRVRDLLKSFGSRYNVDSREVDLRKLDSSLQNLQTNRNKIAHGSDADRLSLSDLDTYYADAKEVVRIVYEECNPIGHSG